MPGNMSDSTRPTRSEHCTHCRCTDGTSVFVCPRNQEQPGKTLRFCQPVSPATAVDAPLAVRRSGERIRSGNGWLLLPVRLNLVNQVFLI
jgi:hypothetical protein